MKKSLLFSAALVAAGAAFAAVPGLQKADANAFELGPKAPVMAPKAMTRAMETFEFSYADTPNQALSLNNLKAGDPVFMLFEMAPEDIKAFAGSKVTDFTVCSPTGNNGAANTITSGRFFYSTDPTLATTNYTQEFSLSTQPYASNKVAMDTPYTITGEEECLVFGYCLQVKTNMYYVVVDGMPNDAGTGIIGVSSSVDVMPTQFMTFGNLYGALCMSVSLERESFPMFVKFASIPEAICLPQGKASSLPVTLSATSDSPIKSVTIEYTLGGERNEFTYSSATPLPAGASRRFSVNLDFPAQSKKLKETVEFKITKVNGLPNEVEGAVVDAKVVVVDEVPVHQTLFEEYTCTKCTWCPRGFAALEYISKNYPDFVIASYHNNLQGADPMTVVSNFPSTVSGNPSAFLNRMDEMDPFYGDQMYMDLTVPMVGNIIALNEIPTVWNISASHEWESSDILVAKAEVSNMVGYENENYTIAYLLVADGLTGTTTSWSQTNGYASYAPDASYPEELNAFCRGGEYGKSKVSGLVFNDVVVSGDGIHGVEGSLPTSLESEVKANHSMSFDLSKIKASLNIDRNKLRVIAAILDKNGQVLNCAKDEVNDHATSAVDGIESSEDAPVEYYNLSGVKVAQPAGGIFIRRQGAKAEKVIVR